MAPCRLLEKDYMPLIFQSILQHLTWSEEPNSYKMLKSG